MENPDSEVELPCSALERTVAETWSTVLGIEPIDRRDRFHELGGTSLDAEKSLTLLRERLALRIHADVFVGGPTLAELAERIEQRRRERFTGGRSTCVALRSAGADRQPPLFCFAGAGATAVGFVPLTEALPPDIPVYAFQANGFESRGIPDWTVSRAASRHLREILRIQPDGPYYLLGHSFGGHIAVEAARRLERLGKEIGGVYLLDTVLSPVGGGSVGDYAQAPACVPSRPTFVERMRTHLRMLGAGVFQYDAVTQQAVFWEQAIRVQNRHRVRSLPDRTRIVISDQNAAQELLWRCVPPGTIKVVRVPGDHREVLNAPGPLAKTTEMLIQEMSTSPESRLHEGNAG